MGGCIGITRSGSGPIEESSGTVSRPNSGTWVIASLCVREPSVRGEACESDPRVLTSRWPAKEPVTVP